MHMCEIEARKAMAQREVSLVRLGQRSHVYALDHAEDATRVSGSRWRLGGEALPAPSKFYAT